MTTSNCDFPNFPDDLLPDLSFLECHKESLLETQKLVEQGKAFSNPLDADLTSADNCVTQALNSATSQLTNAQSDLSNIDDWLSNPPTSLPQAWKDNGYDENDLQEIRDSLANGPEAKLNSLKTSATNLGSQLTSFKGHTDILSGVDLNPTGGQANIQVLLGMEGALTTSRALFCLPFENQFKKLFGSLFDGKGLLESISDIACGNTMSLDIPSFDLSARIEFDVDLELGDLKDALLSDISEIDLNVFDFTIFDGLEVDLLDMINLDLSAFDAGIDFLKSISLSPSLRGMFDNPFKLYMLECVFGSTEMKDVINKVKSGAIT